MIKTIEIKEQSYPSLLRQIDDPPKLLYFRGDLPDPNVPLVAVVGSRQCTPRGRRTARRITEGLARAGVVIVSGLAAGIDAIAHEAALDGGGITMAILASGVDRPGPLLNRPLADRILDHNGALLSEFPPGTPGLPQNFPVRNRIIAGMCIATLVIEAAPDSGSLITARAALNQNRDVFAVPGSLEDEMSKGTNDLIKTGAYLTTSATDILDRLQISGAPVEYEAGPVVPDTKEEALILPLLSKQPKQIDEIIRETGLPTATVGSAMTMMEIKGKVRHVGGRHYIIV